MDPLSVVGVGLVDRAINAISLLSTIKGEEDKKSTKLTGRPEKEITTRKYNESI